MANTELLERTHSNSMFSVLSQSHLQWLDHVYRMDNSRLLMQGHLVRRTIDRFQVYLSPDMKKAGIDPNNWEETAQDRRAWRKTVEVGTLCAEKRRSSLLHQKKRGRKQIEHQRPPLCQTSTPLSVRTVAETVGQDLGCLAQSPLQQRQLLGAAHRRYSTDRCLLH